MKLKEITEGKARLLVPDPEEYKKEEKYDPSWAPVFYNPRMVFNRDVSVVVVSALSPKSIVDALSATGVRGIRYYLESSKAEEVLFNDKSPNAVELIRRNVEVNGIENAKVYNRDANSLLYELKVDYVDVDPFGSPAPFVLSSINATKRGGSVAYTATDLSPLEGKARRSCLRKYYVHNQRLSFSKEVGIRALISKVVRDSAVLERTVVPLISFYSDYYYRVFFRVLGGARRADNALEELGYFIECQDCGYHEGTREKCVDKCPYCGSKNVKVVGPVWLGKLVDEEFLGKVMSSIDKFEYLTNFQLVKELLTSLRDENQFLAYYNLDFLASRHKVNVPPTRGMLECLGEATRTHFDKKGIKTNKKYEEVLECLKTSFSYNR
ncbi:MAG: tRNA (guanine(26)-N(2))-dimethyltransferase [Candidatus Aramenus sp.]|nr:tRNA (guanine(26)-N(2))-dimethyltransferase [Candidatus Aramenus sp.]